MRFFDCAEGGDGRAGILRQQQQHQQQQALVSAGVGMGGMSVADSCTSSGRGGLTLPDPRVTLCSPNGRVPPQRKLLPLDGDANGDRTGSRAAFSVSRAGGGGPVTPPSAYRPMPYAQYYQRGLSAIPHGGDPSAAGRRGGADFIRQQPFIDLAVVGMGCGDGGGGAVGELTLPDSVAGSVSPNNGPPGEFLGLKGDGQDDGLGPQIADLLRDQVGAVPSFFVFFFFPEKVEFGWG